MQRISIALSALISRKQYRLQAASKVTKTVLTSLQHVGNFFVYGEMGLVDYGH